MKRAMLWFVAVLSVTSGRPAAADVLGLYAGGAVGHADMRLNGSYTNTAEEFDHGHFGWKALLGVRPISLAGAEIEYLDFGNISYNNGSAGPQTVGRVRGRAVTLVGLGYVPLPLPFLDVYGKLGVARVGDNVTGGSGGLFCTVDHPYCQVLDRSSWQTSAAYGAGLQFKLAAFAIRAEYERFAASHGQPDMLSLGATFRFGAH